MLKITIAGTDHIMYVNPNDQRGGRMKQHSGLSQPGVTAFWRSAAVKLRPTLVVDAGVNYGEILLSSDYPKNAELVAIEANEKLIPYLNLSLSEHPNALQARTIFAFVSDKADHAVDFYVDNFHSGLSSGHPPNVRSSRKTAVSSVTIDSLFRNRDFSEDILLFKLDVEGYEWNALRGMSRLLDQCRGVAGCIEFNMPYMKGKGIDVEAFLNFLQERFFICVPDCRGNLIPVDEPVYANVQAIFSADKTCNDLVLFSDESLYRMLRQP